MLGDLFFWTRIVVVLAFLMGTAVLVGSSTGSTAWASSADSPLRTIRILIGKKTIQAKVADSDPARQEGLLGWNAISEDTGMLLDFGREGKFAIHMQGMKFPIDAVWIDRSGEIKLVYEDLPPNAGQVFPSMFACRYCLELKAGFCKQFGVHIGGRVKLGGQNP